MARNDKPSDSAAGKTPRMHTMAIEGPTSMVVIEVGPKHTRYHVHKAFLSHHSEFFRIALQRPLNEAEEGSVKLHDVDNGSWNLFVNWLYTQKLPSEPTNCADAPNFSWEKDFRFQKEWVEAIGNIHLPTNWLIISLVILKASTLSDKLLAPAFGRAIRNSMVTLDEFIENELNEMEVGEFIDTFVAMSGYALDNNPPGRPLVQYLVDLWCRTQNTELLYSEHYYGMPHEFSGRVAWWTQRG